jgi:hypothetical protein
MNSSESCLAMPRQKASWIGVYNGMLAAVGKLYCRSVHNSISRPVNGKYRCWKCLREFDLRW